MFHVGMEQLTPPPGGHSVARTPAVMLSPKARKFVAVSCGGLVTLTWNVQEAARSPASRAVQVTFVDPTAKVDPLGGVHVVATGAVPPETVAIG